MPPRSPSQVVRGESLLGPWSITAFAALLVGGGLLLLVPTPRDRAHMPAAPMLQGGGPAPGESPDSPATVPGAARTRASDQLGY